MPEELHPIGELSDTSVSLRENSGEAALVLEQKDLPGNPEGEKGSEKKQEEKTGQLAEILSKAGPVFGPTGSAGSATDDARNLSLLADIESQVTRLLDLATQKGIPHAVHVAQKMKNYYLLDRMHDEMVDKFYQGLVEKGLTGKD